jgi:succinoglycan biosynthesis transport protein ExoP
LTIGAGLAFARDTLDRKLRTREAVQAAARTECLGILPLIEAPKIGFLDRKRQRRNTRQSALTKGVVANASSLDWAMERPRSLFTHTLRRVRAALFEGRHSVPIALGVTSALPGEGKTIVAANIARLAAQWGKRVLLIDAVPYNAQLTQSLAPHAEHGLSEFLRGTPFTQLVLDDRWTQMQFLPGVTNGASPVRVDAISNAMPRLLAQVKSHYDLVVLDLPPLGPVSDVHEFAGLLDKVLLVVEWGRCTDEQLAAAVADSGSLRGKLIGAVLNKADMRKVRQYGEDAEGSAHSTYIGYIDDKRRVHPTISVLASLRANPLENHCESVDGSFFPVQSKNGKGPSDPKGKKNA